MLKKEQKGFTLVELLVAIAIMVTVSAIALPGYVEQRRASALQRSTNLLAQQIRRPLEFALAGQDVQGHIPEGWYGVKLSETEVVIFADCGVTPSKTFNEMSTACGGEAELIERIQFDPGIRIDAVTPQNTVHIMFLPPHPDVTFHNAAGTPIGLTENEAIITLTHIADTSRTQRVRVTRQGLITVEQ